MTVVGVDDDDDDDPDAFFFFFVVVFVWDADVLSFLSLLVLDVDANSVSLMLSDSVADEEEDFCSFTMSTFRLRAFLDIGAVDDDVDQK